MSRVFREDFIQEQKQVTVTVQSSRIRSVKQLRGRQVAVRAFDGRNISIAGALGFPDDERLWKEASSGLSAAVPYPALPHQNRTDRVEGSGGIPDGSDLVEEAEIIMSELRHRYPDLVWNGQITGLFYSAVMRNDRGLDLFFSSPVFKCGLSFRHRDSARTYDGYTGTYGVNYSRNSVLGDISVACSAFTGPVTVPGSRRMPVIICMGSEQFFLRSLLRDLTGSSLKRGTSRFCGSLSRQVLNPHFSVVQTCDSANTGLKHFDKEGTVNSGHTLTLIKNGTPLRPLTDRVTALTCGFENSGSAFSGGYDSVPSVGLPFVRIDPFGGTLDGILGGREALLLILPGGGAVTDDGRFTATVQLGYLYRDGVVTGRIPPANISADLRSLFGSDFLGCSSDSMLKMTHSPSLVCMMDVEILSAR